MNDFRQMLLRALRIACSTLKCMPLVQTGGIVRNAVYAMFTPE